MMTWYHYAIQAYAGSVVFMWGAAWYKFKTIGKMSVRDFLIIAVVLIAWPFVGLDIED
jgi:hypothetical protein